MRASYHVVLHLCHAWARLLLLSAGRRHTAGFFFQPASLTLPWARST